MKKLKPHQKYKISKNLDRLMALATPEDIEMGKAWYEEANEFVTKLRALHDIAPDKIAAVLSALSPRNKWYKNKLDTVAVIEAYCNRLPPEEVKVSTYHVNKYKAFAILRGDVKITEESRKTYSFMRNVGYLDPNYVTVDVWHLRACFGRTVKTQPGNIAYDQIRDITLRKAEKLGITGYEYQAIIWIVAQKHF